MRKPTNRQKDISRVLRDKARKPRKPGLRVQKPAGLRFGARKINGRILTNRPRVRADNHGGIRFMPKVKVAGFSLSMDGFGAGPDQDLQNPLGRRGMELHPWLLKTQSFRKAFGQTGGSTGQDNDFAEKAMHNIGAWILGRNMFGPVRGPWGNSDWKGWWGENPVYHVPVFVLTHHARDPIPMEGGTTFYFITDGIESALKKAKEAAKDKDVRIGGGVSVVRQYLKAGLIDELHFAFSPIFLGQGENLLNGIDFPALGFKQVERVATEEATHIVLQK